MENLFQILFLFVIPYSICQQFPNGQTQSSQYEMLMNQLGNQLGLPKQAPSAFMIVGATRNPQSTEYLSFKRIITQVNSQLYLDYGAYIAELSGIYLFTITLTLPPGNESRLAVAFHVNDAIVQTFVASRLAPITTHNIVLYMIPGQAVFLQILEGFPANVTVEDIAFSGLLVSSYNSFALPSGFGGTNPGGINPQSSSVPISRPLPPAIGAFKLPITSQASSFLKGKYPWERDGIPVNKVKTPFPWQKGGK